MSRYEMVKFTDTFYGVREKSPIGLAGQYVCPVYSSYVFRDTKLTGWDTWCSTPYIREKCFLSKEVATELLAFMRKEEDRLAGVGMDNATAARLIKEAVVVSE